MKQGEIWFVLLNPAISSEIKKTGTAKIVNHNYQYINLEDINSQMINSIADSLNTMVYFFL